MTTTLSTKRAAVYLRVSCDRSTVESQRAEVALRAELRRLTPKGRR